MAHTYDPDAKPALGIGSIISQSFGILFSRFLLFFAIAFAVQLILLAFNRLFISPTALVDPAAAGSPEFWVAIVVSTLLSAVATSLTAGAIVIGAYDAWLGNPMRPGAYFGAALVAIVPLILVSLITNILTGFGFMLLIVPGLYIAAMFSVTTPAIVAESAGFGSIGRSRQLTSGYRWSIVGLIIVGFLIMVGVTLVYQFVTGIIFGINTFSPTPADIPVVMGLAYQLVAALLGALIAAFTGVATAVLFARLKEIKEGVGYEELGKVFD